MTRSAFPYPSESIQPEIDEMAKEIRDLETSRSANEIAEISAGLNKAFKEVPATMLDTNFQAVFLPFFAGLGNPYNVDLVRWVSITGSPFQELTLVNAKGDEVAVVPPVMSGEAIKQIADDGPNMRLILTEAQLRQTITPQCGEMFLRNNLNAVNCVDVEKFKAPSFVTEKWLALFKYFDVTPEWGKLNQTTEATEAKGNQGNDNIDDIVWDD